MSNFSITNPIFANGTLSFAVTVVTTAVESFSLVFSYPTAEVGPVSGLSVKAPNDWTALVNTEIPGRFEIGGFSMTPLPAGSTLLTLTVPLADPLDRSLALSVQGGFNDPEVAVAPFAVTLQAAADPVPPVAPPPAADLVAPVIVSFSPADGSKGVPVDLTLSLNFSEPIQRGEGLIRLMTAAGQTVETFGATAFTVSGSTLTLRPKASLSVYTDYLLEVGTGAVRDEAGNANLPDSRLDFQSTSIDGLYHFFVVAFAAAPGATYMGQLAEAWNFFSAQPPREDKMPVLQQIVEIFTTKKQFTDVYPAALSNRELATQLVSNVVKTSAIPAARTQAIADIEAALDIGWTRGKMLHTVFGNLAAKSPMDPVWGGTAQQFQNQLAVARYFTEKMGVQTENLDTLRSVIAGITPETDVSTTDKIVQIIGTVPPGG